MQVTEICFDILMGVADPSSVLMVDPLILTFMIVISCLSRVGCPLEMIVISIY